MNEYEQAWNDLIKRGFRNNPIFKDVLRELTKKLQGCGWRCLEKLLIEKNVFNEANLTEEHVSVREKDETGEYIVKESTEKHVSDRERLVRALKNIVIPTKTEKSIREGLCYTPKGDNYREVIEKLRKMLPTEEDNNTYCSLDNDGLTYDSDKYSFMSTDANIAGGENGVLYCDIDGTCIILKQNQKIPQTEIIIR